MNPEKPKRMRKWLIGVFAVLSFLPVWGQKDGTVVVQNVPQKEGWEAAAQAFKEQGLQLSGVNPTTQTAKTGYFDYTHMLIANRVRYEVTWKEETFEIGFVERKYKSNTGWVENLLPVSKKVQKKYLQPLADRIEEILANSQGGKEVISQKDNPNPQANTGKEEPLPGLYEKFALVRGEGSQPTVLAIFESGGVMGYQMNASKDKIRALSFATEAKAEHFYLFMDEEGKPQNAKFGSYYYLFEHKGGDAYLVQSFDDAGKELNQAEFTFAPAATPPAPKSNGRGPYPGIVQPPLDLWQVLPTANRLLSVASCVIAIPGGLAAIAPCGSLILDYVLEYMPEDHPYYDELKLLSAFVGFLPSNVGPKLKKALKYLDEFGYVSTLVGGMTRAQDEIKKFMDSQAKKGFDEPIPVIEIAARSYPLVNGKAEVKVDYSNLKSTRQRMINLYDASDPENLRLLDFRSVEGEEGSLSFELAFTGEYEIQVQYNEEVRLRKVLFEVTGQEPESPADFAKAQCMSLLFTGGHFIQIDPAGEPPANSQNSFRIELNCCTDSRISPYGIQEPLQVRWSGRHFQATASRNQGSDLHEYIIEGQVSGDGKSLEKVRLRVRTENHQSRNLYYTLVRQEVILEGLPYREDQGQFYEVTHTEPLKLISFYKRHLDFDEAKNNYTTRSRTEGGFWMTRQNAFLFKLKLYRME